MKKVKGITIWEQFAEFILLGAVIVIFVFYIFSQLSSSTNAVRIDGQDMNPSEIDDALRGKAESLSRAIADDATPRVEIEQPPAKLPQFEEMIASSIMPAETSPLPSPIVAIDTEQGAGVSSQAYVVPEVPPTQAPVARQFFDGIEPSVVEGLESLSNRFASAPYDATWVTAAAVFDASQVLGQYRTTGSNNELPLREKWYNGRVDIMDVIVDREELVDGEWTNASAVHLLPGQFSFRHRMIDEVDASDRDMMLGELVRPGVQESIIRPDFLATLNKDWVHPVMYESEGAGASSMISLKTKFRSLFSEIKKTEDEIDRLGGNQPGGSGGSGGPGGKPGGGGGPLGSGGGGGGGPLGSGGGGGGGPMGSGGGSSGAGGSGMTQNQRAARLKKLEGLLNNMQKQLARVTSQLEDLGFTIGADGDTGELAIDAEVNEVWVWVHDLDVEPEHTYRYRFTIRVYNPFFAKKLSLIPEQQDLAETLTIDSDASDWSSPLEVEGFVSLETTRAVPAGYGASSGSMGLGHAEFEVMRFHDGQWWTRSFPVQPGDQIGGVRRMTTRVAVEDDNGRPGRGGEEEEEEQDEGVDIDFATGQFVLDIIPNPNLDPSRVRFGREAEVVLAQIGEPGETETVRPED